MLHNHKKMGKRMGQTTIIETVTEDVFNAEDGVISASTKRAVKKSKIEPTDEFIKVSKYLNVIFAYNNIPLKLVPISLLIAQEMEFKTNQIYLLIERKKEFAKMLDMSLVRVNALIGECEKYNIIRRQSRGVYEVNSFLFSTGSIIETRELQAHFDFQNDVFIAKGVQTNAINGVTVRKAVANKKTKNDKQIPGQMSMFDKENPEKGKTPAKAASKFNNFPQNTYDFDEFEKQMLDN